MSIPLAVALMISIGYHNHFLEPVILKRRQKYRNVVNLNLRYRYVKMIQDRKRPWRRVRN